MHDQPPASVEALIERLGGVRPAASALGEPPSTVMSWKRKGAIPRWRLPAVLDLARKMGVDVAGFQADAGKAAA